MIDFTYNRLMTDYFKKCKIEILFIKLNKNVEIGTSEFFQLLEKGFKPDEVLCVMECTTNANGDMGLKELTYLTFKETDIENAIYVKEKPHFILILFKITTDEKIYHVFKEIRKVNSDVIKLSKVEQ